MSYPPYHTPYKPNPLSLTRACADGRLRAAKEEAHALGRRAGEAKLAQATGGGEGAHLGGRRRRRRSPGRRAAEALSLLSVALSESATQWLVAGAARARGSAHDGDHGERRQL